MTMGSKRRLLQLVLTTSLLVGSRAVRAAEPEAERVIDIEVTSTDLPETRAKLVDTVITEINRALAEQDPRPVGVFMAEDRRVLIELLPSPIPGTDDVLIRVEVEFEGKSLAESTTEPCLTCTDADVAGKALMLLTPLLSQLPAPIETTPPAPAVAESEGESFEAEPQPRSRRELLIPGGVLLGAGVVGIGVGIGLIVADERLVSPPNGLELDFIKYREPGIATMAISGTAAVTGAVLLGLALRRRTHVAAAPIAGPYAVGVMFSGRF